MNCPKCQGLTTPHVAWIDGVAQPGYARCEACQHVASPDELRAPATDEPDALDRPTQDGAETAVRDVPLETSRGPAGAPPMSGDVTTDEAAPRRRRQG